MQEEKTSTFSHGLLWFGAAVSIAEILAGALLAPLGLAKGMAAILLGHAIGCTLLFLAGTIGAQTRRTAMESVRISFGIQGAQVFSLFNVLQLLGWTAVMIIGGGKAASAIAQSWGSSIGEAFWCAMIGLLILIWVLTGLKNVAKLNFFAVGALFVLTIILSLLIFKEPSELLPQGQISFGLAVELSAAMPLSWLPLISDYTRTAKKPRAAAWVSTGAYFIGSCWMYIIGLGAAIFAGDPDIARIMLSAGLGLAGLAIIILSTVTTTFLDVYSAGLSFANLKSGANPKKAAIICTLLGTLIAIFTPITQYENFLYLIGSVFAPMAAILITDYFILKKDCSQQGLNKANLILWGAGFIIYRLFIYWELPIGSTLPVMALISLFTILLHKLLKRH